MLERRYIKVGGSLFDLADLPSRIVSYLSQLPKAHNVLVCGGGELADVIRKMHSQGTIDSATAHRAAIRCMDINAEVLKARFSGVHCGLKIDVETNVHAAIFDDLEFELPESWNCTSDSISASFSKRYGVRELVLMKSTLKNDSSSPLVDSCFQEYASEIPTIRIVNLRSSNFEEIRYQVGTGNV